MVTFESGTSAVSVNITTIDDDVAEKDEALNVVFDVIPSIEATLNIMRGAIVRSEVVIENNDSECQRLCVCMCACALPWNTILLCYVPLLLLQLCIQISLFSLRDQHIKWGRETVCLMLPW